MTMKKKIVIVALVVCIFAMSIASATLAYFTDTEGVENTFTVGDVEITLTEKNNEGTPVVIDDPETDIVENYGSIFPGIKYTMTPTITNTSTVTAQNDAYVAGIIEITGINTLLTDEAAVNAFLEGGAMDADAGYAIKIVPGQTSIKVYIIAEDALATTDTDGVVLFDKIVIPASWDHAEMDVFKDCTLIITAYATQTAGFDTAAEAIEGAFGQTGDPFAPYFGN